MDSAAIQRALKQKDALLELQGWPSDTFDCLIWKVVRRYNEGPPETVCVWQSDRGQPYPLSSGILDMVDKLDRNTATQNTTEDELNRQVKEKADAKLDDEAETVKQEALKRAKRSPAFHRGVHLRRDRETR